MHMAMERLTSLKSDVSNWKEGSCPHAILVFVTWASSYLIENLPSMVIPTRKSIVSVVLWPFFVPKDFCGRTKFVDQHRKKFLGRA